jgi:SAM-dependent methyltransferase
VTHIDDGCIDALSRYYGSVLPSTPEGRILDLCSSWISHLPEGYAGRVYGIGLNEAELAANKALTEGFAVLDLNETPRFADLKDASFDAVICSVSVSACLACVPLLSKPMLAQIDYLTRPRQILAEVARVLKPGGSAHMAFSNRCFPTKVRSHRSRPSSLVDTNIGRPALVAR